MKIVLLTVLIVAIVVGGFFLNDEDKRWVFFNGKDAEIYAKQLLNNKVHQTPDKFIDYSVSAKDGHVIFSQHENNSTIYGYFPTQAPTDIEGAALKAKWEALGGKWFVSHL